MKTMSSEGRTGVDDLPAKVKKLMKDMVEDLYKLVRLPSVHRGANSKELSDTAELVKQLLIDAGVANAHLVCIGSEEKNAPLVYGTYACPDPVAHLPTVLLYAHYDVVEAGDWAKAFDPETVGNRVYGRGAADDKSGVMMHVGALRAFNGQSPVNLKVVIEGEEESGDRIEQYVLEHPDDFRADVIVVADTGNHRIGEPTFTTSLRGVVDVQVTVTTLRRPVHSGAFGGPVPDAFMALTRMLARLHDDAGDVRVPGLVAGEWSGLQPVEAELRESAGMKPKVKLIGTGTLGARLYTKPSVNVTGLDGPPPAKSPINQLKDQATALVSLRIAPTEEPKHAVELLSRFLRDPAINPWGAEVTVSDEGGGKGFTAETDTPAYAVAKRAMETAYPGKHLVNAGAGGAIPLISKFQQVNEKATILLLGCEEPQCNIHSVPESVDLGELETMTLAECYLLQYLRG
jgi:acetylornithine deacetylase/succinyl-diaminopimelate desuccinylase-like protein